MKLTGVLVVPCLITVVASGFFSPFQLGIRRCSQLCATYNDCNQVNYNRVHLQCEILAERSKHGCSVKRCPMSSMCVVVFDLSLVLCWNRSTETSKYQPKLREVGMTAQATVSKPEVYQRSLDVSHHVLLQMHKRHEMTLLVLFEISSGRADILLRCLGEFHSFALMPKCLVHSEKQPGPRGLYITPVVGRILKHRKQKRLTHVVCTDVVGDWSENTIFFVTSTHLRRMKVSPPYKIKSRSRVTYYSGRLKLAIDVIQKTVYVYGEGQDYLTAFGYTHRIKVLQPGTTIHRLVVGLGPLFMMTGTMVKVFSLTSEGLIPRSDIQIGKDISAISVVKDNFVIIVDGTMRVYNTTSLKLLYMTELKYGENDLVVVDGYVIGPLFMMTGTMVKVFSLTSEGLIPRSDIQIGKDISAISVVKDNFVIIVDGTMRVYNTTSLKLLYMTELKYGENDLVVVDGYVIGV